MRKFCMMICLLPLFSSAAEIRIPGEGEFDYCILCHGTEGGGNAAINAPRIGGMEAWYIERQLTAFRNGWRGAHPDDYHGGEMRPMAVDLAAEQLAEAAAWFAAFEVRDTPDTVAGDAEAGAALYASCAACHGAAGEGNQALSAPALRHQNDWYLVRQLEHYRAGVRGADPADASGQQMRAMVTVLADEQAVLDLVAYINTLGAP